jgi:hypothetical protein
MPWPDPRNLLPRPQEQLKRYRPFQSGKRAGLNSGAKKVAALIARELGARYGVRKVFLFGSLAGGDQGPVFDIDLAAASILSVSPSEVQLLSGSTIPEICFSQDRHWYLLSIMLFSGLKKRI